MRWSDSQRSRLDAGSDLFLGVNNLGSHLPESEPLASVHPLGNAVEIGPPHWENAWIDLGGEG
jgi:hypothetical protein